MKANTPAERCLLYTSGKEICVVSQTTFNYNKFKELVEILCKKRYRCV